MFMRGAVWFAVLLGALPGKALGGANLGGSLVVHATSITYTTGVETYCGQSGVDSCSAIVDSVPWSSGQPVVFFVLAAFPPESSSRLKGISFGVDYDATKFVVMAYGTCADFELPDSDWPDPGSGTAQSWLTTQTGPLVEAYWMAGYAYSEQSPDTTSFAVVPHPVQGGYFADDSEPREADEIEAYGRLGFGTAGALPCPIGGGDMVWVPSGGLDAELEEEPEPPVGDGPGGVSVAGDLTFLELTSTSALTFAAAYRGLRADYGIRVLIGIIPDALICRTHEWQRALLAQDERVLQLTMEDFPNPPGELLPGDVGFAEGVWNQILLPLPTEPSEPLSLGEVEGSGEFSDSLRWAHDKVRQTSMYMMGDVGVSLLFLESDSTGSCEPATRIEDWRPEELTTATGNILHGFMRLVEMAPPGANLTFTVQDTIVPTTMEPIKRVFEGPWVNEAMDDLLVEDASYYGDRIYYLNNRQRALLGWDWWYTTFVVRDSCDIDHRFPGELGCGWGGGPRVVATYFCSNNPGMPPTPDDLLIIPAHETCHVFQAADEYDNSVHCDSTADCDTVYHGYLRVANDNCVRCTSSPDSTCLMLRMPYRFTICPSTAAHLGWRDSDADGVCDPIDNPVSETSMLVGEGDSVRIGDWVDIYQGTTWVRRLAASDWNSDRGRMLWDGIDWRGVPLEPDSCSWRWRDLSSPHGAWLVSDTLAPVIDDIAGGVIERGPPPLFADTLAFSFVDSVAHSGWINATAVSATGETTRVVRDRFVLDSQSIGGPVASTFPLGPGSGYTTLTVRVWDVGGGGSDSLIVQFYPSAHVDDARVASAFRIFPGRPNPGGDRVAWEMQRGSPARVKLRIVAVDGRVIRSWPERPFPAGPSTITWDCRNDRGRPVASGRYYLLASDDAGNVQSTPLTITR